MAAAGVTGLPRTLRDLSGDRGALRGRVQGTGGNEAQNVFDVTPDGQRFLVNTTLDNESTNNPINWVLNWTAELEQ